MHNVPVILMLTHSLGLEGAPRSFAIVARGLAASLPGRVVVFSHADGPLRKELEAVGIQVHVAPIPEAVQQIPRNIAGLERYCRENMRFLDLASKAAWEESLDAVAGHMRHHLGGTPDLVFANTVLGFWGIALARLWKVPSVWCIHESEPPFSHLAWLPREIFDTLPGLLAGASRVVFASKTTEDVFLKAGHTFTGALIPNGLPPDMPVFTATRLDRRQARISLDLEEGMLCFLALGSVFERKGQTDLCRAMALLPDALLDKVRCHIVGDRPGTPYSGVLHHLVNGLPDRVRRTIRVFTETPDTALHYRVADVFVMCSRMESYPFVILEAMSQGLPIITTPAFGIREQVTEREALFYQPGDVTTLASHVAALSRDAAQRTALGRAGMARFSRLPTYKDMMDAYYAVVMQCLKKIQH